MSFSNSPTRRARRKIPGLPEQLPVFGDDPDVQIVHQDQNRAIRKTRDRGTSQAACILAFDSYPPGLLAPVFYDDTWTAFAQGLDRVLRLWTITAVKRRLLQRKVGDVDN